MYPAFSPTISFRLPCTLFPMAKVAPAHAPSQPTATLASTVTSTSTSSSLPIWATKAASAHSGCVSPHSKSYYASRNPNAPFFEGWYLRLTLQDRRSFAFMFSVEKDGPGTVQVLDAEDRLHVCGLGDADRSRFYGNKNAFEVAHWGYGKSAAGRVKMVSGEDFGSKVLQGYQLGQFGTHGRICGGRDMVQWGFEYLPVVGWGKRGRNVCTASWLSRMPLFEPGYQVLMAHGVCKEGGYLEIGGERVEVGGGVVYCEKNWGRGFPKRWWWMQGNLWEGVPDLSLTACGAVRRVLAWEEVVGIIAVHFDGEFYEFSNWSSVELKWQVEGWGSWKAQSRSRNGYTIEVEARTSEGPVDVLGPSETGMVYNVRDNARGWMKLTLRDDEGTALLDGVETFVAQVEAGGEKWEECWNAKVEPMSRVVRGIVNLFHRSGARTR